jgi:DnaD/phage-associated family protein
MASILVRGTDESISISPSVAKQLVEKGNGDAALLYIALLRRHGTVPPRGLAGELRWEKNRIEAAEAALRDIGLLMPEILPEPADEPPEYQTHEISEALDRSEEFRMLTTQVESRLGKKLSSKDLAVLLGLYDYLGLPATVIYLLVNHCCERIQRRYGPGRTATMRQIEKEGYAWSRMGLDNHIAANEYLKKYAEHQGMIPAYMRALHLGDRMPVASEEKYLTAWQEWGFPPEVVALACDRTVYKCHELKWPYCNGILKRWHEAGLHTVDAIEARERPARTQPAQPQQPPASGSDNAWMRKFIQQRKED